MAPDLNNIVSCLDESQELSENKYFMAVLEDLKNYKKTDVFFCNYSVGSFSLNELSCEVYARPLKTAQDYLYKSVDYPLSLKSLLKLNQIITTSTANSELRLSQTSKNYPFPSPKSILDGIDILLDFLNTSPEHSLIRQIAFIQGMISLHPFTDGNHRTFRLLLDHWLQVSNLPCTTLNSNFDFIFANPTNQKLFSLEVAVEKVLICIGNTIQSESYSNTPPC